MVIHQERNEFSTCNVIQELKKSGNSPDNTLFAKETDFRYLNIKLVGKHTCIVLDNTVRL